MSASRLKALETDSLGRRDQDLRQGAEEGRLENVIRTLQRQMGGYQAAVDTSRVELEAAVKGRLEAEGRAEAMAALVGTLDADLKAMRIKSSRQVSSVADAEEELERSLQQLGAVRGLVIEKDNQVLAIRENILSRFSNPLYLVDIHPI
jgi:chromosome segregation ATPase